MVSFLEGVVNGVRSVYCALLASNDFINGGLGPFVPGLREIARDIYLAQRRLAGCDPEDDVPEPTGDFTGGQCPIKYRVTFTGTGPTAIQGGTTCIGSQDVSGFADLWGPIGNLFVQEERCTGGPGGNGSFKAVTSFGNAGQARRTTPTESRLGGTSYSDLTITSVVPLEGGADVCGDPPPIFPPPTNIDIDVEITYEGDDGTTINLTVPFTFAPITANFDGSLRIPFTFNIGPVNFNGNVDFAPNLPVTINLPTLPTGSGQGAEEEPPDQPGESVEPEPPERKIIGVVVTATTIQQGRVSSYDSPGIPEIYVPRLGSVKFVYNLGGATFFSSDIDIKDRRTFIECPFAGGADAVIASPQVGVDFSFLPIRGFPLATTGDLARLS